MMLHTVQTTNKKGCWDLFFDAIILSRFYGKSRTLKRYKLDILENLPLQTECRVLLELPIYALI